MPLINISMEELRHEFDNSLKVNRNGNKTLFYRKWPIFIKIQWKGIIISHLVPYKTDNGDWEGRICLFDSQNRSVENIAKFNENYSTYAIANTQNKMSSYVRYFE